MPGSAKYSAIVVGASAGGLTALTSILCALPKSFSVPIIVVQHRSKEERDLLETVLQQKCEIRIKQADEKEMISPGFVYIAPPDYHLLIESSMSFSLTIDETVNYSRPSIDVLFESAAQVYREKLIGIVLTGSNSDGSNGIKLIHKYRGLTIAQNPDEAQYSAMPLASIRTGAVKKILMLKEIHQFLISITND
jgi:two-component system, chemotaxis family, protein-glutamate methylesterase/glutaminase